MKKFSPCLLAVSLALCGNAAFAQEQASTTQVPAILEVQRELIKPGKAGAIHDKSEAAFVQAFSRAKWPTHYIALNSLSGRPRAIYMTGYPSFDAWEKDTAAMEKSETLAASIERAQASDGDLLEGFEQHIYRFMEDLSYRPDGDLSHARFLEVSGFQVKSGHGKEFSDLVKKYIEITKKANTSAHWATYRLEYGGSAGVYVVLSSDKSMAEIDKAAMEDKQVGDALTDDDKKEIRELRAASVESEDDELFSINPKQSYPPDEWVKADAFWKPVRATTAAKSASEKQAGN